MLYVFDCQFAKSELFKFILIQFFSAKHYLWVRLKY